MSVTFSDSSDLFDRIQPFVGIVQPDMITLAQWNELEQLLCESDDAQVMYLELIEMSVSLPRALAGIATCGNGGDSWGEPIDEGCAVDVAGDGNSVQRSQLVDDSPRSSVPAFSASLWHGTVGDFSFGWPVAYLIATMIFGVGAFTYVSQPAQVAQKLSVPVNDHMVNLLHKGFVGQITGTIDCRWGDPSKAPVSAHVVMGQEYALTSGLVEITYYTGAKVILQGPAEYTIGSENGGFLSNGKLTGKVETKSGKGFTIRTPTAAITDLGTEFGVEVDSQKSTRVCVLQGEVGFRSSVAAAKETTLKKGQALQVDAHGTVTQQPEEEFASLAKTFVRSVAKKHPDFVSLSDLVAGGNGFGHRSESGISPLDGTVVPGTLSLKGFDSSGKEGYQRYSALPQIDGVFVPNGGGRPVQLDSAGHTFALPDTCGQGWGPIWASKSKGLQASQDASDLIRQLTSSPHPIVLLHANAGITFNLEAIQRTVHGCNATRFQTVVRYGSPNTSTTADVWVFIDGQLRFSRAKLCCNDGPVEVDVRLKPNDKYLTLVSTDSGDRISFDMVTYHNPRLLLEAEF